MISLAKLHELAAQRGDGLRPELMELLHRTAEGPEGNPALAGVHRHPLAAIVQAGPDPAPCIQGDLPENVLRFRPRLPGGAERQIKAVSDN